MAEAVGTGIIVGGGCGIVAATKYAASGAGLVGIWASVGVLNLAILVGLTRHVYRAEGGLSPESKA